MSSSARRLVEASVEPFAWETVGSRPSLPLPPSREPGTSREIAGHQARIAELERDAFAKGFAEGERAGGDAAAARADGALRRLGQAVEELAALRGEMIRRTERQVVQLVLAIAERVVHREVSLDRGLLLGMARAALDRLGEHGTATIRLHPDDFAAMGATHIVEGTRLQIVADPVVSRAGCFVQCDFGFMDTSPDAQFRELARALLSESETPSSTVESAHGIVLR